MNIIKIKDYIPFYCNATGKFTSFKICSVLPSLYAIISANSTALKWNQKPKIEQYTLMDYMENHQLNTEMEQHEHCNKIYIYKNNYIKM